MLRFIDLSDEDNGFFLYGFSTYGLYGFSTDKSSWADCESVWQVIYAYHGPDKDAPAAPSFSVRLIF